MNERIKDLAEQCFSYSRVISPGEPQLVTNKQVVQFAELIVRECLGACSKQAADWEGDYADAYNDGVRSCMGTEDKKTLIKELLGVNKDADMA
jgi:hypothetical protein